MVCVTAGAMHTRTRSTRRQFAQALAIGADGAAVLQCDGVGLRLSELEAAIYEVGEG
jgi:hypothetical protein